jgi:hypothetical protein
MQQAIIINCKETLALIDLGSLPFVTPIGCFSSKQVSFRNSSAIGWLVSDHMFLLSCVSTKNVMPLTAEAVFFLLRNHRRQMFGARAFDKLFITIVVGQKHAGSNPLDMVVSGATAYF